MTRMHIMKVFCPLIIILIGLPGLAPAIVVPAYNSLAGSSHALYLNFGGIDYPGTWNDETPGVVPAYDVDGDASTFSSVEFANIQQIWGRVAEAYSPFDLNVTTVAPGEVPVAGEWSQIVIAAQNASGTDWYKPCAGVAWVYGFTFGGGIEYGTGWTFTNYCTVLNNGDPKECALTATHEAGHQFGLYHQKRYDANGDLVSEYRGSDDGNLTAPIMGSAHSSIRALWSDGTSASAASYQLDRDILATALDYRPDDDNNDMDHATPLVAADGSIASTAGVIKEPTENDFYSFTTGAGEVTLNVLHNNYGGMLDSKLLLYDDEGSLLQSIDPALTWTASDYGLDASFSGYLEAGTYYLGITSHGGYGDVGQYAITGTIAVPEPGAFILLAIGLTCLLAYTNLRRVSHRKAVL